MSITKPGADREKQTEGLVVKSYRSVTRQIERLWEFLFAGSEIKSEVRRKLFKQGIVLFISAIFLIIAAYQVDSGNGDFTELSAKVLESIGLGLFFGTFFTLVLGTGDYTEIIAKVLERIVVQSDFVSTLTETRKKELMLSIARKNAYNIKTSSILQDYYSNQFDRIINIGNESVRGKYNHHSKAYVGEDGFIYVRTTIHYNLYPNLFGKFGTLTIRFLENNNGAEWRKLALISKGNKGINVLEDNKEEYNGRETVTIDLDDGTIEAKDCMSISMEYVLKENNKHSATIGLYMLKPTSDLAVRFDCDEGLEIDEVMHFLPKLDIITENHVVPKKVYLLNYYDWIPKGHGLLIKVTDQRFGNQEISESRRHQTDQTEETKI